MKPVRTWIVIADGARARVLVNKGVGKGVAPVEGAVFEVEHPPSGELTTDRPGRSFDSVGGGRHAMEPSSDPRRRAKKAFLRELAAFLHKQAEAKAYDRLVILAPPQALGDLRGEISDQVQALVIAEEARDLAPVPNDEIPKHLEGVLAI